MTILASLAAVVTATGISAPSYADIYETLQAKFQSIYGSDAYIDPDSQDGQWLAILAQGFYDCNLAAVATYNSYSPSTAQGVALSSEVKINGIARAIATSSQAVVSIGGQVGATILNGIVGDAAGNRWDLPASVIIPPAGTIDVTATCELPGSTTAAAGTITKIVTPTLGWQTVTNAADASPGQPVETDAALRQRQSISTALPSLTVMEGIVGALEALPGVTQVVPYENDTNATDANGLPEHSISFVILGGVAQDIGNVIAAKKTPGTYSHGTTVVTTTDQYGLVNLMRYFIPTNKRLLMAVTIKAMTGYSTAIGDQIKQALADYVNALISGTDSYLLRLALPAQLYGGAGSETFELLPAGILQSISPASPTAADVVIAFNERATLAVADITLTVT